MGDRLVLCQVSCSFCALLRFVGAFYSLSEIITGEWASPPSSGLIHFHVSTAMTKGLQAIVLTFFDSPVISFVSFLLGRRYPIVEGSLPKGFSVRESRI